MTVLCALSLTTCIRSTSRIPFKAFASTIERGECLYDKEKTPFRDPSDLFREEFSRELTSREKTDIEEDYAPYVGRAKVEDTLRAYAEFFSQEERGRGGR